MSLRASLGVVLGYVAHFALLAALGSLISTSLPLPSPLPAVQGAAVGLVLLLGFALPPLVQLRVVPPLRVLRKDIGLPTGRSSLGYLVGLVGFLGLLLWSSNDLKVGTVTAGGFAGGLLLFALTSWGALQLLSPLRAMTGRLGISWRFALAAVQRRPVATIVQLVSLAVGLMALLLLTVTRTDLVSAWRSAAPPDAPNRFVINVQPDQVRGVGAAAARGGHRGGTASDDPRPARSGSTARPSGRKTTRRTARSAWSTASSTFPTRWQPPGTTASLQGRGSRMAVTSFRSRKASRRRSASSSAMK